MRAYKLCDPQKDNSAHTIGDTRKPQVTLRQLNKLKHIRRQNQVAHDAKMALLPQIYSGERLADEAELRDDIGDEIKAA